MQRGSSEVTEVAFQYLGPTAGATGNDPLTVGPAGAAELLAYDARSPDWWVLLRLSGDGSLRSIAVYPAPDFDHPSQGNELWDAWMERDDLPTLSQKVASYFANLGALDGGPPLTTTQLRKLPINDLRAHARSRAISEALRFAETLGAEASHDRLLAELEQGIRSWVETPSAQRVGRKRRISDDELLEIAVLYVKSPSSNKIQAIQAARPDLSYGEARSRVQLAKQRGFLTAPPSGRGRTDCDLTERAKALLARSRPSTEGD